MSNTQIASAHAAREFLDTLHRHSLEITCENESQPPAGPAPTARVMPRSVTSIPGGAGTKNWCAQAAATSLITAWGHQRGLSEQQLLNDLYNRFPPDINNGDWGTSPGTIARMLGAYGLRATIRSISVWLLGGFMNPANQAVWQPYRAEIEDNWIQKGYPAICCVDVGMLPNGTGANWLTLHYIVLYSSVSNRAAFCNGFPPPGLPGYVDSSMNLDRFHEAWECRIYPSGFPKFLAIVAQP